MVQDCGSEPSLSSAMTLPRNEEKFRCKSDYNNFILCAICVMFLANSNWWTIIEIRRLLLASIMCDFTGELGRWVGPMILSKNKSSESHCIFPSVSSVTMNIPLNKAQTRPRPIPSPLLKTFQQHLIALWFKKKKKNNFSAWPTSFMWSGSGSEVAQSCPTFCDPMDCSPPDSSIHGILQARILEWVAISFSRGPSYPGIEPRSPSLQAVALTSEPPGNTKSCGLDCPYWSNLVS